MVTFKLVEETEKELTFWYYPEGREDKDYGIIVVDREKEEITIVKIAEDDWERDIPAEEINILIDAINQVERETGGTNFAEYVGDAEHCVYYGDHAVSEIAKYLRKGEVPKNGFQIWY